MAIKNKCSHKVSGGSNGYCLFVVEIKGLFLVSLKEYIGFLKRTVSIKSSLLGFMRKPKYYSHIE